MRQKFDQGTIDKEEHTLLIILALNVLQPPIRSEYTDMRVVYESETRDPTKNYLVKTGVKSKKPWAYLLNDYKTVKTYGIQRIVIERPLQQFLTKSFKLLPRDYVLSSRDDPASALGYGAFRGLTQKYLGDGAGVDQFRSSYVSKFLEQHPSEAEKEALAKRMLTSTDQINLSYRKLDDSKPAATLPSPKSGGAVVEKVPALVPTNDENKPTVDDLKAKRVQIAQARSQARRLYRLRYYEANAERLKAKQRGSFDRNKNDIYRKRIIGQLIDSKLAGVPYNIRQSTLQKYSITDKDLNI
jgi:hypothetical protein